MSKADITEVEEEYVLRALRSGWVAPLGPDVDAFEAEIAARVGVKHALALSSGTAALHLALIHLGARSGTVVVLPTMTFAATANAVVYTGAEPVFVDSRPDDGNVDPNLFIDAVDQLQHEGRRVAAVMTVDLFGRACDYDAIEPALAERGIPLIEDAAEALGATYQGRAAGSFGQAAALSFNGNKIMTTSGGGMLLSDDQALIAHARKLSTQAREPFPWYEHTTVGYNYRLSNILAALGRGQLSRLDEMIGRRQAIRNRYVDGLADLPVRFLGGESVRGQSQDNCWLTTVLVEEAEDNLTQIMRAAAKDGIELRHLWKPMHLQPVFGSARSFIKGTAEHLFANGLTLPSGAGLLDEEIDRVIKHVRQSLTGAGR
nr:DegT/DnrJ/EryC1/StrS family aminotransferase [Ornithinimicrobium cryptoxanthini]